MKFFPPILCTLAFFSIYMYPSQKSDLNDEIAKKNIFLKQYADFKNEYNSFNNYQKLEKWKFRILHAEGLTRLSSKQKSTCKEIGNFLSISLFENSSFLILDSLRNRAIAVLGKEKCGYIFATMAQNEKEYYWLTIQGQNQTKSPKDTAKKKDTILTSKPQRSNTSGGWERGSSCNCSTASDFCFGFSDCASSDCERKSECGFMWRYECNGICR